ncbi:hypothetical protein EVB87_265 [Rhizobium phage RHph_N28_1]|nr:hypothetical protein EVB87_265 [Rhizobium phage RHph_N28_1]QIG74294.1 hypothetical protein EVC07_266 [Rhizobium phage RHph_N42]QXV73953.1 hypothetical protein [Rhizobium phage RHph_N46]
MSNLNPLQIDRYTLYLDRIVIIKISDTDTRFYDVAFFNGSKLALPRELKTQLETQLPDSFLRYDETWVNDMFVLYMDVTWDERACSPVLLTYVEGQGVLREYGSRDALSTRVAERIATSSSSQMDSVEVKDQLTEQINSNYADLFNTHLTS